MEFTGLNLDSVSKPQMIIYTDTGSVEAVSIHLEVTGHKKGKEKLTSPWTSPLCTHLLIKISIFFLFWYWQLCFGTSWTVKHSQLLWLMECCAVQGSYCICLWTCCRLRPLTKHFSLCFQDCTNITVQSLKCPVPDLSGENLGIEPSGPLELGYGLIMDGVKDVQRLTDKPEFSPLYVYMPPVVYPFDDVIKYTSKMVLNITVRVFFRRFVVFTDLDGPESIVITCRCQGWGLESFHRINIIWLQFKGGETGCDTWSGGDSGWLRVCYCDLELDIRGLCPSHGTRHPGQQQQSCSSGGQTLWSVSLEVKDVMCFVTVFLMCLFSPTLGSFGSLPIHPGSHGLWGWIQWPHIHGHHDRYCRWCWPPCPGHHPHLLHLLVQILSWQEECTWLGLYRRHQPPCRWPPAWCRGDWNGAHPPKTDSQAADISSHFDEGTHCCGQL